MKTVKYSDLEVGDIFFMSWCRVKTRFVKTAPFQVEGWVYGKPMNQVFNCMGIDQNPSIIPESNIRAKFFCHEGFTVEVEEELCPMPKDDFVFHPDWDMVLALVLLMTFTSSLMGM